MSRIRNVKPEIFRHENLQDLENAHPGQHIMLSYIGIWTQCDKRGVFEYRPRQLHLEVLPFLNFDMAETLRILVDEGYIVRFENEGKEYGHIPTFKKHQAISTNEHRWKTKLPPPPSWEGDPEPNPKQGDGTPQTPEEHEDETHKEHAQARAQEHAQARDTSGADILTSRRIDFIDSKDINTNTNANTAQAPTRAQVEPSQELPKPKPKPRFTPPTLDEVTAYCAERHNNVAPSRWLAYYEANGWHVGRHVMHDWRAAVRTWEGNGYENPPGRIPGKRAPVTPEKQAEYDEARAFFAAYGGRK